MTTLALGDLVTVRGGGTPRKSAAEYYGGGIPWVTPKDMKSRKISGSLVTLSEAGVAASPAKLVPAASVLVVVRSGVLRHSLPVGLTTVPVTVNQDMKALTPGPRLDAGYLFHLLEARSAEVLSWVRATTADNFPIRNLMELEINLPPMEEQRRIAAILDHANALSGAAAAALASFDDLRAATFRHMFGDVEAAMHECGCAVFGDHVAELQGGRNLVGSDPSADAPYRVLKISAVTSGIFRPGESKPLPNDYVPAGSHLVRPGDLLMSRANTTAMVGATVLVSETPPNLALPDKLWRLVWRAPDRVEPTYMATLLQTPAIRRALSARSSGTGGSMKNISKAKLMQMPFPVARISDQAVFAQRVRAMDSGSGGALKRLRMLDDLARTLQARAFSGKL